MPLHELRKSLEKEAGKRVKIFTANRTYEGTLSPFPSGEPAVGAHSLHLSNVTVQEAFVKQPISVDHITIAVEHVEAYTM